MFKRSRWITFAFFCLGNLASAHSQTIFDVPEACSVALKQDLSHMVSSSSEQLAYLGIIDQKSYNVFKQDIKDTATIPIEGIPLQNSGDFNKFEEQRNSFYQSVQYNYNQASAMDLLSQTTSARAYKSFDTCMQTLAQSQQGFYAWRTSEDQNDLIASCQYHSPPAASFPHGVVPPINMKITVTGGTFNGTGKSEQTVKLGAFDQCPPVIAERSGKQTIILQFSGGGYNAVLVSKIADPPDGTAILSYAPKKTVDETVTVDQTTMPYPLSQGTMNMDGWHGGCTLGPMNCDPVTGTHMATILPFWFEPPEDGDLYDPSVVSISAVPRDVAPWNGASFCGVYTTNYLPEPGIPSPGQAPQSVIDWLKLRQGKHRIEVITRCWSRPALWKVSVREYHNIDDNDHISTSSTSFRMNEDFILSLPVGLNSKIEFTYQQGKHDIVKAGDNTGDGKIKCVKTFDFGDRTFYVYHYAT